MLQPLQVSKRLRFNMFDASCIFALLLVIDDKLIRGQVFTPTGADRRPTDAPPIDNALNQVANSIDNPINISQESVSAPSQVNVTKNATDNPVIEDIVKQVISKKCRHQYSITCLKLDVVKLVDHLGSAESYQILPGVSLVYSKSKRNESSNEIPTDLAVSLVRDANSTDKLDKFLFQKVDNFISSLSINVRLIDSKVLGSVRKFSVSAFSSFFPSFWPEEGTAEGSEKDVDKDDEDEEKKGRKKKDSYQAAAMWSAGTLAAVGFSALAAMSGKALMTSMIALLLAAMSAFKHHGGGKTSHYEIITKPAHYHDHDHLHSTAYTGAPYSYARHLVIAPADDERPPDEYKIPFRPYPLSPTYMPVHDK